ncbi:MAG: hypothetical protein ACRDGJ_10355 [Candidatus Limnocylindria bacterium]
MRSSAYHASIEAIDLPFIETGQFERGQAGQAEVGLGPGRRLVGEDAARDQETIARIALDERADGIPHECPLRTARHLIEAVEEQKHPAAIERRPYGLGGEPQVLRPQPADDESPEAARFRDRERIGQTPREVAEDDHERQDRRLRLRPAR